MSQSHEAGLVQGFTLEEQPDGRGLVRGTL